jgi:hypothetical protein
MGQYCLILENTNLPFTRYQVIDGQWRPDSSFVDTTTDDNKLIVPTAIRANQSNTHTAIKKPNVSLDKMPLDLPVSIEPYVKGLLTKANSIVIYWEDIAYVRPATNPTYQQKLIESDLLALKEKLEEWALQMQKIL